MSDLIDIAAARETVLESMGRRGAEEVPVAEGLGRVLAEDVRSDGDGELEPGSRVAVELVGPR